MTIEELAKVLGVSVDDARAELDSQTTACQRSLLSIDPKSAIQQPRIGHRDIKQSAQRIRKLGHSMAKTSSAAASKLRQMVTR